MLTKKVKILIAYGVDLAVLLPLSTGSHLFIWSGTIGTIWPGFSLLGPLELGFCTSAPKTDYLLTHSHVCSSYCIRAGAELFLPLLLDNHDILILFPFCMKSRWSNSHVALSSCDAEYLAISLRAPSSLVQELGSWRNRIADLLTKPLHRTLRMRHWSIRITGSKSSNLMRVKGVRGLTLLSMSRWAHRLIRTR
jgi:hypothetical protein